MTKRRIALEPRKPWTADEDAIIRQRCPHEPTVAVAASLGRSLPSTFARAHKLGVVKTAAYLASPAAGRLGHGQGGATRFQPGQVPPNKGLRRPGWGPGRMRETQFKPGQLAGRARALLKPVGAERVSKDGYLERKVHNDMPEGASPAEANRLRQRRWRGVHLIIWEEANGRIPSGYAVCFKSGDKRDIRLDNLELVKRADLIQRNSIHNLPPELKQTVQLLGRVNRQIRKRERNGEEQDQRPS